MRLASRFLMAAAIAAASSCLALATPASSACTYGARPDFAAATSCQDLWWVANGAESGWGINLAHQGDNIFASWLTYDTEGAPLWLTVTAAKTAPNVYRGDLNRTTGPAFNAVQFDPANVTRTVVGTATFTFANGNSATFAYMMYGVSQTKTPLQSFAHSHADSRASACHLMQALRGRSAARAVALRVDAAPGIVYRTTFVCERMA